MQNIKYQCNAFTEFQARIQRKNKDFRTFLIIHQTKTAISQSQNYDNNRKYLHFINMQMKVLPRALYQIKMSCPRYKNREFRGGFIAQVFTSSTHFLLLGILGQRFKPILQNNSPTSWNQTAILNIVLFCFPGTCIVVSQKIKIFSLRL